MAEAHPVGFQWVEEARRRGAVVVHVDPRFTRTSAQADRHIPIRAGSDIALLGGLINHVLTDERDQIHGGVGVVEQQQLRPQSDAEHVGDASRTAGEPEAALDGGLAGAASAGETHGQGGPQLGQARVRTDPTLTDPFCVFQLVKRHYARYTPEVIERTCGISQADFAWLAEQLTANSGRERTASFCYATGWTQHTDGAQMIRAAGILQLLLGNMGRPGGGIMALRGHACIQGSRTAAIPKRSGSLGRRRRARPASGWSCCPAGVGSPRTALVGCSSSMRRLTIGFARGPRGSSITVGLARRELGWWLGFPRWSCRSRSISRSGGLVWRRWGWVLNPFRVVASLPRTSRRPW